MPAPSPVRAGAVNGRGPLPVTASADRRERAQGYGRDKTPRAALAWVQWCSTCRIVALQPRAPWAPPRPVSRPARSPRSGRRDELIEPLLGGGGTRVRGQPQRQSALPVVRRGQAVGDGHRRRCPRHRPARVLRPVRRSLRGRRSRRGRRRGVTAGRAGASAKTRRAVGDRAGAAAGATTSTAATATPRRAVGDRAGAAAGVAEVAAAPYPHYPHPPQRLTRPRPAPSDRALPRAGPGRTGNRSWRPARSWSS